jgi:hypothetical protein
MNMLVLIILIAHAGLLVLSYICEPDEKNYSEHYPFCMHTALYL